MRYIRIGLVGEDDVAPCEALRKQPPSAHDRADDFRRHLVRWLAVARDDLSTDGDRTPVGAAEDPLLPSRIVACEEARPAIVFGCGAEHAEANVAVVEGCDIVAHRVK